MIKETLSARLDYFGMVHSVTLKAIRKFANSELDFRPRPGMRSPRELVFHIYTQAVVLAEAAQLGRLTSDATTRSEPEAEVNAERVKALATTGDLESYATTCHENAGRIFRGMSEEALNATVEAPYGAFPAWAYFFFAYDEHWHHRGQLYAYLRLLGKEPPMLYDY